MTDRSPHEEAPRPEPGFVPCGAAVLLAVIAYGALAVFIAAATTSDTTSALIGGLTLVVVVAGLVMSSRNPRIGRCLAKGLAAVAALGIIVFGTCLAILAG